MNKLLPGAHPRKRLAVKSEGTTPEHMIDAHTMIIRRSIQADEEEEAEAEDARVCRLTAPCDHHLRVLLRVVGRSSSKKQAMGCLGVGRGCTALNALIVQELLDVLREVADDFHRVDLDQQGFQRPFQRARV